MKTIYAVPLLCLAAVQVNARPYYGERDGMCAGNGYAWRNRFKNIPPKINSDAYENKLLDKLHNAVPLGDPSITDICNKDMAESAVNALVAGDNGSCDIQKADLHLNACALMSAFQGAIAIEDAALGVKAAGGDDPMDHTFDNAGGASELLQATEGANESEADSPDRNAGRKFGLADMTNNCWNVVVSGGGEYCKDLFPRFPRNHRGERHPNYWIMESTLTACKTVKRVVTSQRRKCVYIMWGDPSKYPMKSGLKFKNKFSKELTRLCKYFSNMKYTGVKKPKRLPRCPTCGGVPSLQSIINKKKQQNAPVNNGGKKVQKKKPKKKVPKKKAPWKKKNKKKKRRN